MAETGDWRLKVSQRLTQRDQRLQGEAPLFQAFNDVYERLRRAEDVVLKLEGTDTERELQSALKEVEALKNSLSTGEKRIQELEDQATKLKTQLKAALKDKVSLNTVVTRLTNKLNTRTEEHQHRNKSIELLNDEFIAMQIQNNLLHDKVDKLEKENDDLVQRWLQKVQQDADKINDILSNSR